MEKITPQNKDIIVLSFHDTLYPNPQANYLEEIIPHRITRALDFFYELYSQARFPAELNPFFVLISKNESALKQEVLNSLKFKGYQIHKIFSYLNHHPDAHEKSLLIAFPKEVGYKQAKMHYYIWLKITKEKYKITLTDEEKAFISQEAF